MIENSVFIIFSGGIALLLFSVCILLGARIVRSIKININTEQRFVFSIGLGVGTVGVILFFMGILGLYTKTIVGIVGLLISILCIKEIPIIKKDIKAIIASCKKYKSSYKILLYTNITFSFLIMLTALNPETEWDAISYHLASAKIYATNGALVPIYYAWHSAPPHLVNLLYIVGEIFQSDVISKVFITLVNLSVVFCLWAFTKKYFEEKTAIVASTILLTTPILLVYFSATYIDLPLGLFVLLAVWSFWEWKVSKEKKNETKWLILTAIFCGFACTTKLVVAPIVIILGFAYWYYALKEQRKNIVRNTIIIGIIIGLLFLPWWTFNYIHFDNPLYPWAESTFDGRYWSAELDQYWSDNRDNYLNGTSFWQFLLLPITFTFMPNVSGPIYGFSPLYFGFIPLIFLYKWEKEKEMLQFVIIFIISNIIAWFIAAPDWRYIFYLVPFLALLAGYGIMRIFNDQQCKEEIKKVVAISIIVIILSNLLFFFVIFRLDLQLWTGQITREEFKAHDTQNYWVAQYVNKNLPDDAILFLGYDDKSYYFERETISGNAEYSTYIHYQSMENGNDFYQRLQELGVTYLVVTIQEHNEIVPDNRFHTEYIRRLYEELIDQHTELVYAKNDVSLYKLI